MYVLHMYARYAGRAYPKYKRNPPLEKFILQRITNPPPQSHLCQRSQKWINSFYTTLLLLLPTKRETPQ